MKAYVCLSVRSIVAISNFLQHFFLVLCQLLASETDEGVVERLDARLAFQFGGRALCDETTVREKAYPGAEAFGLGHVVRREQDGRALARPQSFEKGLHV